MPRDYGKIRDDRVVRVRPGQTFSIVSDQSRVRMWVDHLGRVWRLPECLGKLNFKNPSHQALRAYVLWRDKVCMWCGADSDLVADHIVSRRNGGEHHPKNLQALCQRCNSRKSGLIDAKGRI